MFITLLAALAVRTVQPQPNPANLECYIREQESRLCVVYVDKTTGKYYDRFLHEIPDPFKV